MTILKADVFLVFSSVTVFQDILKEPGLKDEKETSYVCLFIVNIIAYVKNTYLNGDLHILAPN